MQRLVALCLEQRASLLVLSGDLVDASNRLMSTGLYFIEQMLKLESSTTEVVLVLGNHDAASPTVRCWMLPSFVRRLGLRRPETRIYGTLGIAVHGISYSARNVPANLLASYPKPVAGLANIGLLHTSAEGGEGHEPYAPCTRRQLKERGYDYFALGHVHRPEIIARRPWVVFSGTPQGRSIRDRGPRGAVVVSVQGPAVQSVEFRALDVVRFVSVAVLLEGVRGLSGILERLDSSLRPLRDFAAARAFVVRLIVRGGSEIGALLSLPVGARSELLARALDLAVPAPMWLESVWAEVGGPCPHRFRLDLVRETCDVG